MFARLSTSGCTENRGVGRIEQAAGHGAELEAKLAVLGQGLLLVTGDFAEIRLDEGVLKGLKADGIVIGARAIEPEIGGPGIILGNGGQGLGQLDVVVEVEIAAEGDDATAGVGVEGFAGSAHVVCGLHDGVAGSGHIAVDQARQLEGSNEGPGFAGGDRRVEELDGISDVAAILQGPVAQHGTGVDVVGIGGKCGAEILLGVGAELASGDVLIQPVSPADVGLDVGGAGTFGADEAGGEDGHDLIEGRTCGGAFGGMGVLNPKHCGGELAIERRRVEGVGFEDAGIGLELGGILTEGGLGLRERHLGLVLDFLAMMSDQPGDTAGDAGTEADERTDAAGPTHHEGPCFAGLGIVVGHWVSRAGAGMGVTIRVF